MKLQNLAVIFIIIIMPISMVLTSYIQSRVETLNMQISYDQKLYDSTYDAIIAFQKNTVNSSTSDLANSKLRDIKAAANSFFISAGENFGMSGYGKKGVEAYVPALVFTLYDGYYIYAPYTNKLDTEANDYLDDVKLKNDGFTPAYSDSEQVNGLKPYIYYSCRYKNSDTDVVINYALDSYITITGTVKKDGIETVVNWDGYLLSSASYNDTNQTAQYRNVTIENENPITEKIIVINDKEGDSIYEENNTEVKKENGVKYYKDNKGEIFTNLNSIRTPQQGKDIGNKNDNAVKYYKQAAELKTNIQNSSLKDLKVSDAIDENGKKAGTSADSDFNDMFSKNEYIFSELTNPINKTQIEDEESKFNEHRVNVIKHAIERNLSIAISNYNQISEENKSDFKLPKLKDYEWDRITKNISMISFLQGMNIGGKIYNGYAIVNNNKNEEYVSEDSIYILTNDNVFHSVRDSDLETSDISNVRGYFNVDFEIKSGQAGFYCPRDGATGCYNCIISSEKASNEPIKDILNKNDDLAKIYYTALGRERYGMYRIANKFKM